MKTALPFAALRKVEADNLQNKSETALSIRADKGAESRFLVRVVKGCSLTTVLLGLFGAVGANLGDALRISLHANDPQISLGVSLAFILLGGALFFQCSARRTGFALSFVTAGALLAVLLAFLCLSELFSGVLPGLQLVVVRLPASFKEFVGSRLSPVSAFSFLCITVALYTMLLARARQFSVVASILSLTVGAANGIVVMGYVYGAPLFYGGNSRPIGLISAVGSVLLSAGVIAALGPDHLPFRAFLGPSVRARLLRTFLPTTFLAVLLGELISDYMRWHSIANPGHEDALQALIVAIFVTAAVSQAARVIGKSVDLEETERFQVLDDSRRALDELERRVREATRELAATHDSLRKEITERQRTELALGESEAKTRAILDAIPDSIFRVRNDGTSVDLRSSQGSSTRRGTEDTAGKALAEGLSLQLGQLGIEHSTQVLRSGEPEVFELQFPMDGELRDYEIRFVRSGEAELLALVRDITERRRLEKEVLEVSAREQHRIGQDLHDGLGQLLTGIAFMSRALQQKLVDKSLPEGIDAGNIVQLLVQALGQTRNLAKGLFPVDLETHGLSSGLRELSSNVEELFGISCIFFCGGAARIPDHEQERHLFRVAQEAINNAIKHGKAHRVEVRLEMIGEQTVLTVKDDGVGFTPRVTKHKGMGLNIMYYRARRIGATLNIHKHAEGGTVVSCSLSRSQK